MHWRSLIVVEPGAEATVVEQYLSTRRPRRLLQPCHRAVRRRGREVRVPLRQDLSEQSWILGSQRAQVDRDASLHWVGLGLGSGHGKLRMETDLQGRGADGRVTGAYVGHGRQHIDYDTTQEHAAPDTTSDLAFRGILRDRATAVWSGMIRVDPDAQRTDAFQESRNLLLCDGAHADAIPGLEIEANDVRCTHAATSRDRRGTALLPAQPRARRADAERLLVGGFLGVVAGRLEASPSCTTLSRLRSSASSNAHCLNRRAAVRASSAAHLAYPCPPLTSTTEGGPVATLHIEHPITDLETWLGAFTRFEEARKKAGVRAQRIHQPVDDDNYIYVALDFDSVEEAASFKHFLETTVWASAEASPALAGTPRARVLTEVSATS